MSKTMVAPDKVRETLARHVLADGYDLTLDMERSQGVTLYDSRHRRELLDLFTCFASMPLGYNHPKMLGDERFLKDLQLAALTNPSNSDIYTTQYAEFMETFEKVAIRDYLNRAFFIAGGGLAVENCLKAAMDWKVQKNFQKGYRYEKGFKVLHFEQAFHGRTGYTMSLTNTVPDKTRWFAQFNWPRVSNPMIRFPYTDAAHEDLLKREKRAEDQIRQHFAEHKDEICAIIIEPIQSEGGDHHFRKEFMEKLRSLCTEFEALLIYDEVQTGVGLSGKFWCHEHFGPHARPDLLAFGKKMQVCGVLAGPKLDEIEKNVFRVPSRINSTWGGNLVDMVRSRKVLEIIQEDNLCDRAAQTGEYLLGQLQEVAREFPVMSNVRGRGLICAFDFPDAAMRNAFLKKGMEQGVMFLGCGLASIRFRPALIFEKDHVNKAMEGLRRTLKALS